MSAHSPAFRRGLASIKRGEILIPPLRAYLMNPDFEEFTVTVKGMGQREPDYHFHPSQHPGASEMALWLWMVRPEILLDEPLDDSSMLAVTVGKIWHDLIEGILMDMGLLTAQEVFVEDPETKARGNMDGIVVPSVYSETGEIFEFKTAKADLVRKVDSVETYIQMYPGYYLQAIEYMRLSGYRRERVVMMALSYPYEMREFVIEYDMDLANQIRDKYMRVLQAVADGRPPMCSGCGIKSDCPARGVCQHIAENGGVL